MWQKHLSNAPLNMFDDASNTRRFGNSHTSFGTAHSTGEARGRGAPGQHPRQCQRQHHAPLQPANFASLCWNVALVGKAKSNRRTLLFFHPLPCHQHTHTAPSLTLTPCIQGLVEARGDKSWANHPAHTHAHPPTCTHPHIHSAKDSSRRGDKPGPVIPTPSRNSPTTVVFVSSHTTHWPQPCPPELFNPFDSCSFSEYVPPPHGSCTSDAMRSGSGS
jgi:hypothetical protein